MKVSITNTCASAIPNEQTASENLSAPAAFEKKLICPVTFSNRPSQTEASNNQLTKPIVFVTDSTYSAESIAPQPTTNDTSPTQTDASNNLIKPVIFATDSTKADKSTEMCSAGNDNIATTCSTCTPAPQSKIVEEFVPCVNSAQRTRLLDFPPNDSGNVERFFEMYGDIVRYVCAAKKFFIWNGKFWQVDDKKTIHLLCEMAMRSYFFVVQALESLDADLFLHARASCNAGKINALVSTLQHHCAVDSRDFDAHPHLLNVRNGIVNLQTGQITPHNKNFLLSKYIDVDFFPERASTASNF